MDLLNSTADGMKQDREQSSLQPRQVFQWHGVTGDGGDRGGKGPVT